MRIVVNDIAASEGGALSILFEFYEAVKKYDFKNEYIFLLSAPYVEESERIKVLLFPKIKKSHFKKIFFDFVTGKKIIRALKADLVFSLQNIIIFGTKVPQIVYIHQSIPYQKEKKFSFIKADERKYAFIQYIIGGIINISAKKAAKVIVQTEWMKNAVCEKSRKSTNAIWVFTPSLGTDINLDTAGNFCSSAFFYPTSDFTYKNNSLPIRAAEILVSEGICEFKIEMTLPKRQKSVNNVIYLGRISRDEVMVKYAESTLIFPSYIETYGLPLAEAKKVGTIILAANCDYAYEVLNDYENAYFFDYTKPEELALLMKKVIYGEITLKKHIERTCTNDGWEMVINLLRNTGST